MSDLSKFHVTVIDQTGEWTLDLTDDPQGREPNEVLRDRLNNMTPAEIDA